MQLTRHTTGKRLISKTLNAVFSHISRTVLRTDKQHLVISFYQDNYLFQLSLEGSELEILETALKRIREES